MTFFIVPPNVSFESFVKPAFNERTVTKKTGVYGSIVTEMPLGILSLSSYLKKNSEIEIKLLDFNIILNKLQSFEYNSFTELFHTVLSSEEWVKYAPTIIGISTLYTPAYHNMLELGKVSKEVFKDALVIAGGGVPTNMYPEIFKTTKCFDALCYGEGEKPMLALVSSVDKHETLNKHTSWVTKEKAAKKARFAFDFIEDLDEIPFPDYDILELKEYRSNSIMSLFPLAKEKKKSFPILTSRGCTHKCCFCSSHTVHGRKMRYYSIGRIKKDFSRLKEKYKADVVIIIDDHFMSEKKRFFAIIEIIKNLGLTSFFPSSLALYALDRKVLEALKSIGVDNLVLSVESGSERVLREIMHKPLNLAIVKRVIEDCREINIASDISILIGLPGETKKDLEDALTFLKTLNATWFRISMATPLVGSEMLDICLKNNYIRGDFLDCDFKKPVIETKDFTPEFIKEKAYLMNLELNFAGNSEMRLGNFSVALKGFENTIKVKDDHAFAYYYAAQCYKETGKNDKYILYKEKYNKIIKDSLFWRSYAEKFGLPPLD
ncbi:MAG: B12-binding domain-containing radical SAM protein [Candidatus Firestonebacteria bacterium RIFOXYA2_FULL_40_8]|nr:MAG: B12-binding domain-containing radical SAM protein [Candidatus Firestonebacteria bacterium RIFOXYA2_FULL_40_8]